MDTLPNDKKSNKNKLFLILTVVLFCVVGVAMFISMGPVPQTEADLTAAQEADVESAYADGTAETASAEGSAAATGNMALPANTSPRALGNPEAPLKVVEYASLSCTHCAHFHKDTFDSFKAYYIDTGRAYFVYEDFPLNAPALHATLISRCLPEDKFFSFIGALFREQETWATAPSYLDFLREKSEPLGLTKEQFDVCLKDENAQKSLMERMKAVQEQWKIGSTPSFVVNNQIVLSGSLPYAELDKKLQEAAAELKIELPELPKESIAAPAPVEPAAETPAAAPEEPESSAADATTENPKTEEAPAPAADEAE